jgi:chemotaxis protein MotB
MAGSKRRGGPAVHENEERWLLTYADMITLLMALFMVLFSISSVNISKYITLQESLKAAFSGSILPGGRSILQSGSESTSAHTPATSEIPSIVPLTPNIPRPVNIGEAQATAAVNAVKTLSKGQPISISPTQLQQALNAAEQGSYEQSQFVALQQRINAYAKAHGFASQVTATVQAKGLVVTILTDKLLFSSGSATLEPASYPLLSEMVNLIHLDTEHHPIDVAGYTDNVPIDTSEFPSNWYLSTARASSVVEWLIQANVPESRLTASGYSDQFPVANNGSAAGRALNRRVQIVFERLYTQP